MDGWYAATVQVMNHYKLKMKKRAQHTLTRRTATRTTRKRTVTSGLPTTRYPLTSNLTTMMIIIINSIRDFAPKQTLTHVPVGGGGAGRGASGRAQPTTGPALSTTQGAPASASPSYDDRLTAPHDD
jgi:hypothetical protein